VFVAVQVVSEVHRHRLWIGHVWFGRDFVILANEVDQYGFTVTFLIGSTIDEPGQNQRHAGAMP
jgi:hypothetical protein